MKFKLTLLSFLIPFYSFAQQPLTGADSARRVIDTALSYARLNSLYSKKVNFKQITDSVKLMSKNAATIKEAMPAVALMYKLLGDFHGAAYYQGKPYKWNITKATIDKEKYKELIAKYWKGKPALESRMLENGYGYICIPANNPTHLGESRAIAMQIQDSLMKLHPAKLKGIIVDLRLNTGGSLWPMALGLGNLFSRGTLGVFVFPKAGMNESWSIKDTVFYTNTNKEGSIRSVGKVNPKIKIAVLTSPYTASSGEALAISFKGQKNARVIGDITAGYTTANDGFSFYGVQFLMANAVEADRTGHVYYDNVSPGLEVIAGDNFNDFTKDAKITAALKWMKSK